MLFYEATEDDQIEVEVHGATSELSRRTGIRHAETPADELTGRLRERSQ